MAICLHSGDTSLLDILITHSSSLGAGLVPYALKSFWIVLHGPGRTVKLLQASKLRQWHLGYPSFIQFYLFFPLSLATENVPKLPLLKRSFILPPVPAL